MRTARSIHRGSPAQRPLGTLRLDYDARQKGRLRGRLTNGEELAILLPRGTTLEAGDWLATDDGEAVLVEAATEALSVARTDDALLLARVAYHLGNRHVALAVEAGRLAYRHDHVLDDLVRRFGLAPSFEEAAFRPEGGAYGAHDHPHTHSHDHSHEHPHDHDHDHDHAHAHAHHHPHEREDS
jgi:urease accessory protein